MTMYGCIVFCFVGSYIEGQQVAMVGADQQRLVRTAPVAVVVGGGGGQDRDGRTVGSYAPVQQDEAAARQKQQHIPARSSQELFAAELAIAERRFADHLTVIARGRGQ